MSFPGKIIGRMNRLKPPLDLLLCNVLWAMAYPFYNYVLPPYIHHLALV